MNEPEFSEKEITLKSLLTDEFLATLVECVRVHGNLGDSVAQADFARAMFELRGFSPEDVPDLTPYDHQEE